MIYKTGADYLASPTKRVLLFGMSGLGKTHLSNMLRDAGDWFHYSVDYRIGTRYMGEYISDNFKREAMLDTPRFVDRAQALYGYPNFICDTSGSICEVVEADNPADPVMKALSESLLLVWIKGSDAHKAELARRFDRAPKPMYYRPEFLKDLWAEYLDLQGVPEDQVDPDAFLRFGYARLLDSRQPRYEAMARWGLTITAEQVATVTSPADLDQLIAQTLDAESTARM